MKSPSIFSVSTPLCSTPEGKKITPEGSIVWMARVSSPKQRLEEADKLLKFLVQHGHWSPFDMVDMTVEIETSRAIMAQILRHWSFRFQEFSQRYSEVENGIDWSHVEARLKAEGGNRQGSGNHSVEFSTSMGLICEDSEKHYQHLVEMCGISPETARMVLPLATPTRAFMKGSVRSWMTYFWQRCDGHAQKEHRGLADQLFQIFQTEFPVIANLIENYKPTVSPIKHSMGI